MCGGYKFTFKCNDAADWTDYLGDRVGPSGLSRKLDLSPESSLRGSTMVLTYRQIFTHSRVDLRDRTSCSFPPASSVQLLAARPHAQNYTRRKRIIFIRKFSNSILRDLRQVLCADHPMCLDFPKGEMIINICVSLGKQPQTVNWGDVSRQHFNWLSKP